MRDARDDAPGVRWQAVLAIGDASWDLQKKIPPLLDRLSDTNEFVAAAAAGVLGKIGATNVAPILFTNLEQRLQAPRAASVLQEQFEAVHDNLLGNINEQSNPFDPDNLLGRAQMGRMGRFAGDARRDPYTFVTSAVEALGELNYQPAEETILGLVEGPNGNAAATALKKLAPAKLTRRLLTVAADKNAPPQSREDALLLLSDAPGANPSDLLPLLDDRTVIPGVRPMPGREWRICDRAATTLAALLGRTVRMAPMMPTEMRDEQIEQVRQWLKAAY
jgi:HEAT repeat protein